MKVCVIQPHYSLDMADAEKFFGQKIKMLDECDESVDLIVLPEYSDVPCAPKNHEQKIATHEKYFTRLDTACKKTAKRCGAVVFYNALDFVDGEYRNTTFAIDKNGEVVGKYYKRHIPIAEKQIGIAYRYTERRDDVYTVTIDGVKYAFLTCYDFYFYEYFSRLARENVDVVIGCSLQRSDTHQASEITCRFLAYNTNAYVVRASVSFDEKAEICGASQVVAPDGTVLLNMASKIGVGFAEFDPKAKYFKPAGFGREPDAHYQYIEIGRTPWQYRPAGSAVCTSDKETGYPRVCAHRGYSSAIPQNSLASLGAAVGLGADEIEFDIWATKDGKLVSMHDGDDLGIVCNGSGCVWEKTFAELQNYDFGVGFDEKFAGLGVVTFEDVLKKFACHAIMNIHVKIWDMEAEDDKMEEIVALIRKYDCASHVYFMTRSDGMLEKVGKYAPDIARCVGFDGNGADSMIKRAVSLGAQKVQLYSDTFTAETIKKAHENGIICNVFYSDDDETTEEYLKMGVDTILTNAYVKTDASMKKLSEEYRKRKSE